MVDQAPSSNPPPREVELKLRLPSASVPRLRRVLAGLQPLAATRPQSLRSTYFDTGDRRLSGLGWRLRVRQKGRRHLQTLKATGGGLAGRVELETMVNGQEPEPGRFDLEAFPDLAAMLAEAALEPLFTTEVKRSTWLLSHDEAEVEVALDIGEVRAGDAARAICEVELELKQGDPAALYGLAQALAGAVPLHLDPRAKSDRGFDLLDGHAAGAVRAMPAEIAAEMSVDAAFRAIAESCLGHALLNQEPALAGLPDGVHQLRVALRRLRSACSLFRPALPEGSEALVAEVKWLAGELGPARDFDVFAGTVLEPLGARTDGFDRFAAVVEACRTEAHARLRAALESPRTTQLWLALGRWLATPWPEVEAQPVTAFADAALAKRARKLRKAARNLDTLDVPALHRVRIIGKRLRYAVEFFRTLYRPKPVRRYLAAMAHLQEVLGVLNDSDVGAALLQQAEARAGRRAKQAWFAQSRALVEGWYAAQAHHQLAHLGEAWDAVAACKRFWNKPAGDGG